MSYKLNISFTEFLSGLDKLDHDAQLLISEFKNDSEQLHKKRNEWENLVCDYLESSISPRIEQLIDKFKNSEDENLEIIYTFNPIKDLKKKEAIAYRKEQFVFKINEFRTLKAYLFIIDSLKNPKSDSKGHFTSIKEKLNYILEKLYALYGDEFYSINKIMSLNNIQLFEDETSQIAKNLEKKGYVLLKDRYSNPDLVKISVRGAEYVERIRKSKINKSSSKNFDVESKIDTVLQRLKELGYGQQIIFDELEELREVSKTLSKKSISEIVKGKVFNLVLSEAINKETAIYIYEYLTGKEFKLLS